MAHSALRNLREPCLLAGPGGNEPNWAIEIASLKKDVDLLISEVDKLRGYVDKRFDKRERDVDRDFVNLKVYLKDELSKLDGRFMDFTPLHAFKPLVWWFRAIGIAVITSLLSVAVAFFTWVFNALTKNGGGSGGN